jgi:hypothetical protein
MLLPSVQYLYFLHSESSFKLNDHHKIEDSNYIVLAIRNGLFILGVMFEITLECDSLGRTFEASTYVRLILYKD